jgi:hypothetical protein
MVHGAKGTTKGMLDKPAYECKMRGQIVVPRKVVVRVRAASALRTLEMFVHRYANRADNGRT